MVNMIFLGQLNHLKLRTNYPVLIGFILFSVMALHGGNWRSIGPNGGSITSVHIDPINEKIIYALGNGQIYRSRNGGVQWENISPNGWGDWDYYGVGDNLYLSSESSGRLYLIGAEADVLVSDDAGDTWSIHFQDSQYKIIYIDPDDADRLVAYKPLEQLGYDRNPWRHTLVKSVDNGLNWTEIVSGIDTLVGSIKVTVNPYDSSQFIAIQDKCGGGDVCGRPILYISENSGDTWALIEATSIQSPIFDPLSTDIIYGWSYPDWQKTTDRGITWVTLPLDSSALKLLYFTIDPLDSDILFGAFGDEYGQKNSVAKSSDGGLTWTILVDSLESRIFPQIVSPRSPDVIYGSSHHGGVYKSEDRGISWQPSSKGIHMSYVNQVAVASADIIYASENHKGIMRSRDRGSTWDLIVDNPYDHLGVVIVAKNNPNLIYTKTLPVSLYIEDPSWGLKDGLALSEDGGDTWKFRDLGLGGASPFDISADGEIIYSLSASDDSAGVSQLGVMKSNDRGKTWDFLELGIDGVNWGEKIQVDPTDANILYAALRMRATRGNTSALVRSNDGGSNWEVLADGVWDFYLNKTYPSYLYYPASNNQFFFSSDHGNTWTESNTNFYVYDLVVHPSNEQILFANTHPPTTEILLSKNHGQDWTRLSNLGKELYTNDLAIAAAESVYLFAGTRVGGVQLLILDEATLATKSEDSRTPIIINLAFNYPNPFNNSTTIEFDLQHQLQVSLIVYDILGGEIYEISDETMGPGNHKMTWNGHDAVGKQVPSGIYFARLVTPDFSKSIKMVLLK